MVVCLNLQANGACTDMGCSLNHDIRTCDDCHFFCESAAAFRTHVTGREHRNKISSQATLFRCSICSLGVYGPLKWEQHVSSDLHCDLARRQGLPADIDPEGADGVRGQRHCILCDKFVLPRLWSQHLKHGGHLNKELYASFKSALREAEKNKHGVTVSEGLDFGLVDGADARHTASLQFRVETTVPDCDVRVVDAKLTSSTLRISPSSFRIIIEKGASLRAGWPITGTVKLNEDHYGRYEDRLEVLLEDQKLQQRFVIVRCLRAIVGNKEDHELLKPQTPFVPKKRFARQPETDVIAGIMPSTTRAISYTVALGKANIPQGLLDSLLGGSFFEILGRVKRIHLPHRQASDTYSRQFKTLLWVEEYRMGRDLETYDICDATLTQHGHYYYLPVPGLAEKRPSVLVGDRILVQKHGVSQGHWFEGGVHVVRRDEVGLRFGLSFTGWSRTQQYNVRFKLNRIPMRRQHQALDTAFVQDRLLLPRIAKISMPPKPSADPRIRCFNKNIETNTAQLQAVRSIIQQPPGSLPFVVFGPPGTGKTVTIVEAIRQIVVRQPEAHILACAPSNSAADLIATRLAMLGPDQLFRFYAVSRQKESIPDELQPFTSFDADGHPNVPPKPRLGQFKVVVTTYISASVFYGIGISRGHFSHMFFDEAGQSTEPEAMVGIKTLADNFTNVVLSGDPKQLGPIIRSNIARELGLETSYLERVMSLEMYDDKNARGVTFVKLVQNFRSHNAILKFPNERFYQGDLLQCGESTTVNAMVGSPQLVSKDFPVVFHAVAGKDDREASSPSFFNIDEATQVKAYVEAIRADRKFRVADQEIGIIAPYHAQCLKLRSVLRAVADGIKVGSVEDFQGQERKVIIISTVRSSREFVEYDLRHTLGFVANPRRFNVAVTRAQALLIVVGDPSVLSLDPLWRSFLNYVHNNGGWRGNPITWDASEPVDAHGGYDRAIRDAELADMNDFTRRMESLTLSGVRADDDDDDDGEANVDRPWRDME